MLSRCLPVGVISKEGNTVSNIAKRVMRNIGKMHRTEAWMRRSKLRRLVADAVKEIRNDMREMKAEKVLQKSRKVAPRYSRV